jgi:hypothetical protein
MGGHGGVTETGSQKPFQGSGSWRGLASPDWRPRSGPGQDFRFAHSPSGKGSHDFPRTPAPQSQNPLHRGASGIPPFPSPSCSATGRRRDVWPPRRPIGNTGILATDGLRWALSRDPSTPCSPESSTPLPSLLALCLLAGPGRHGTENVAARHRIPASTHCTTSARQGWARGTCPVTSTRRPTDPRVPFSSVSNLPS